MERFGEINWENWGGCAWETIENVANTNLLLTSVSLANTMSVPSLNCSSKMWAGLKIKACKAPMACWVNSVFLAANEWGKPKTGKGSEQNCFEIGWYAGQGTKYLISYNSICFSQLSIYRWVAQLMQLITTTIILIITIPETYRALAIYRHFIKPNHVTLPSV